MAEPNEIAGWKGCVCSQAHVAVSPLGPPFRARLPNRFHDCHPAATTATTATTTTHVCLTAAARCSCPLPPAAAAASSPRHLVLAGLGVACVLVHLTVTGRRARREELSRRGGGRRVGPGAAAGLLTAGASPPLQPDRLTRTHRGSHVDPILPFCLLLPPPLPRSPKPPFPPLPLPPHPSPAGAWGSCRP